ncbi:MAG: hypothetical protein ACFCGT_01125 [Sandaracinaceae bacterium]
MTDRLDVWRSFLRSAADAGAGALGQLHLWKPIRRALREIRSRRARVPESVLSSLLARAPEVAESTVEIVDGRVAVATRYADGESLRYTVVPEQARFAPRGAKEVLFQVEPPGAHRHRRVQEAVGLLAATIAQLLWRPLLSPPAGLEQALIDIEGARLRADLRSVPSVRRAIDGSPFAPFLDAVRVERFELEDRSLGVVIALPGLPERPPTG